MASRKEEAVKQVVNLLEGQRDCVVNNITRVSERSNLLVFSPVIQDVHFQRHPIIWTKKWCFLFRIAILKTKIKALNTERDRLEALIEKIKKEAKEGVYNTAVILLRARLIPFYSLDDFPVITGVNVIKILELIDIMEDAKPASV
jgi:cell division protein FtsB